MEAVAFSKATLKL